MAVGLKYKLGYDDSLDVVGVHLVGGLTGTVLIGLFATDGNSAWYPDGAVNGLFYGGGFTQLATQIIVAVAAMVISAAATYVIAIILKATIGLRVTDEVEINGVDLAVHGETAYETLGARRTGTDLTGRGDTAYETTGSTARVTTEAK
jgi:Amt family ammonium transporter